MKVDKYISISVVHNPSGVNAVTVKQLDTATAVPARFAKLSRLLLMLGTFCGLRQSWVVVAEGHKI